MFAAGIAGFTRPARDDDIRRYLHEELYRILEKGFEASGIPWSRCFREDRGDGALVIITPGITAQPIVDPLPERLRSLIRRHNHVSRDAARIQLRTAAHLGPVDHDGHGFIGSDVDFLFRMLDARPLKNALDSTGADLALIVSEYIYGNVVCRHPSLVSPDAFRPVRFQVKHTRARAWTYLPSGPPSLATQSAQAREDRHGNAEISGRGSPFSRRKQPGKPQMRPGHGNRHATSPPTSARSQSAAARIPLY
jgi:hypothetical protein